jgi:hypothetical protein
MDSGKIAEFTREDSIAINTISVVTLFFLPAMLVAVRAMIIFKRLSMTFQG